MKIAYFSDNFYPELSGIVDSILITGKELTKRGHEVIYIGPRYAHKDYALVGRQYREENGSETIDGLPVVRLPSIRLPFSPTGQSHFAFPTGKSLRRLKKFTPDIIHTQSPYGCGAEARRAAKRFNIPLVGTNHTPVEEFYPFAPMLMRRFDAWYYNHCSFVSAPFEQLIENMRQVGFTREGRALPNPVVHSLFNRPTLEEKATIREKFGLGGPVVLYAGRIAAEKHIDLVIQSIAKLRAEFPTIKLVITGHGSAKSDLEMLVQQLHLGDHVLFTGFIPSENLALYYKASDVFAIMSTADSQSIALMQAFATGIPAVGARSRGLPDYILPECGFLVRPGDVHGLTEQLGNLLRDEALRQRLGDAAMQSITRMEPDAIAAEWETIYTSAIAKHRAQQ